ncbi:FAD dependent oxidoreductase [Naematelia encephala]|uniref:FAD dependent oxidoreductase n=1 Tax=Naematelia encephala TaxID=71784 RepID=A0A1Y2AQD7_9TREE|nr:FAD dependent oxidoreductase [Naematelia encephala]
MTTPDKKIAIVGAGVFGLSTALHLARSGYKSVTVFDYQPYDVNAYNPSEGCDSASSDVNKIYRCSYGDETEYQDLAFSGRPIWKAWNEEIAATPADQLPKGLTPDTKLFLECGMLRVANGESLSAYDQECLDYLEKAGLRHHQHVLKNKEDMDRLETIGKEQNAAWVTRAHVLDNLRHQDGKVLDGFIDSSAGVTYADKSCAWARHLCEKAGVKFVLGPEKGKFDDFIVEGEGENKVVKGLKTVDGLEHSADVVIIAGGGWTPSLVPEVEGILETTAGSVCTVQIPEDRKDLWDKFSPDNFPAWAYGLTGHNSPEFGGFYGFPRTPDGKLKMGYRGRKWTNYQTNPKTGKRQSVPKTKYTADKAVNLPKKAITLLKQVIGQIFPELTDIGITDTRMCWYTDSLDNSFIIDYVPGYSDSLFVASGGSGHGFKFLPVLGKHVKNQLEHKPDQFTPLWKWRTDTPGAHANGLEEGEKGGRNLADLEFAEQSDWVWAKPGAIKIGGEVGEKEDIEKIDGVQSVANGLEKASISA